MKQTLQLKLSQHLTLTPQLQQSIRLLQLSTIELNQELEQFLADNPLLEREDSIPEPVAMPLNGNGSSASTEEAPAPAEEPRDTVTEDRLPSEQDWFIDAARSSS